jgi:LPS sulfotransferase NodH
MLSSTGVAGHPESYFREPDLVLWARRFAGPVARDDTFDYRVFAEGALRAGSTPNGVFGARVMWGSLQHMVGGLALHWDSSSDLDVLVDALGPLHLVHVRREDVVAQAVSWARAEQTGYWQQGDRSSTEPRLDLGQIDGLVQTIQEHNAAWQSWFGEQGARPYSVTYEELVADPGGIVKGILHHLNVEPPSGWRASSPHSRQADELTADWVQRYRAGRHDLLPPKR